MSYCFFFNDTATTEIYTLSLHDALPISMSGFIPRHIEQPAERQSKPAARKTSSRPSFSACAFTCCEPGTTIAWRSDRKSTRLNSSQRQYLVCRLLLEKKKFVSGYFSRMQ